MQGRFAVHSLKPALATTRQDRPHTGGGANASNPTESLGYDRALADRQAAGLYLCLCMYFLNNTPDHVGNRHGDNICSIDRTAGIFCVCRLQVEAMCNASENRWLYPSTTPECRKNRVHNIGMDHWQDVRCRRSRAQGFACSLWAHMRMTYRLASSFYMLFCSGVRLNRFIDVCVKTSRRCRPI
jgi:hypothetical protein